MTNRNISLRPLVLKAGDAFGVFDEFGNILTVGPDSDGVFLDDTRHLSRLVLSIEGGAPLLLSSVVAAGNTRLDADLTNADLGDGAAPRLVRNSIHIHNKLILGEDALLQTLEIANFAWSRSGFHLELGIAADFVDLFELRGTKRARHGETLPPRIEPAELTLGYRGLDGVTRRTRITFDPPPERIAADGAGWRIELEPAARRTLQIEIHFLRDERRAAPSLPTETVAGAKQQRNERARSVARCETSNDIFNEWLTRSRADLDMLITDTAQGPYPYAGIPWFATPFGRDGLITALECLWLDPGIAAGVLRFLAARQATSVDRARAAEPGKILHETRKGEMAALGEIPFGLYYGSVDSTPLFVILADAYHARTGDLALVRQLWPNIEAAIAWMSDYGDADGDGFIEYGRHVDAGLANQGWKDSYDAIFHRDGSLAEAPIALVEVQAYAYAAYRGGARLASLLGFDRQRGEWMAALDRLRQNFEKQFWCEELGLYALALDCDKRPCQVATSNAGHVLFGGLASERQAKRVAERMLKPDFFSGWGIRTVAKGESRYNPMSYHNGSIWPHDMALFVMGLANYSIKWPIVDLMTSLFAAASAMPSRRLPELFCGFPRREEMGPVTYPTACSPQSWSSAAVFAMLGAALGISLDADARQVRFRAPVLPPWLPTVRISNLRLADATVDLLLERHDQGVAIDVCGRRGEIEVIETG